MVNAEEKLVGRVTVNAVMDFIREESESEALNLAGLREEEDLFAPVWKSLKNRWTWLAINLVTAFIASRGHRHIRGFNRKTGRTGGIDADHCRHRR